MPSALNGLTQLIEQQGTTPRDMFPQLRSMVMSGEAWPVDFIERMEEAWGAPIFEGYGASQTYGCFIMSNCELGAVHDGQRGALHWYEWAAVLEVLDPDTLEPVGPGETGELVVTHFEKEASPLIRFRTRDKVTYHPWTDCSCGRQLDFLQAGTIGRWDDMVKVKGENVFPPEVDEIVFARPEIGEYQARVFIGGKGRDEAIHSRRLGPGAARRRGGRRAPGRPRRGAEAPDERDVRDRAGAARRAAAVDDARHQAAALDGRATERPQGGGIVTDDEVVAALREIGRLASEVAAAGGDHLGLQTRAMEIAAMAEVMLWSVAPDESDWLVDLYGVGAGEVLLVRRGRADARQLPPEPRPARGPLPGLHLPVRGRHRRVGLDVEPHARRAGPGQGHRPQHGDLQAERRARRAVPDALLAGRTPRSRSPTGSSRTATR